MNANKTPAAGSSLAPHPSIPPKRPARPFELKLLVLGLLVFSWMGWVRFEQTLVNWAWLQSLGLTPAPPYLAASGALWGLLGLAAALGLWLRLEWGIGLARIAAAGFALSYWLERLLLRRAPEAQANLPFALAATALGLVYAFGVLSLARTHRARAPRPEPAPPGSHSNEGESS